MSTIVNRRDVDFYLDEMFDLGSLLASDRYGEHDRESITAILDLCQSMAEEAVSYTHLTLPTIRMV